MEIGATVQVIGSDTTGKVVEINPNTGDVCVELAPLTNAWYSADALAVVDAPAPAEPEAP